jgi:hypothetical protein
MSRLECVGVVVVAGPKKVALSFLAQSLSLSPSHVCERNE